MGKIHVVVPQESTNYVLNPSAEIAGNFAGISGITPTRVTTDSLYGRYAFSVPCVGANDGISLTVRALSNADHAVTLRLTGDTPSGTFQCSCDNANWHTLTAHNEYTPQGWAVYYAVSIPAAQCSTNTTLYIRQTGAVAATWIIDGVQCEPTGSYWTTFIDGTQEGCEWLGTEHASSSERDAMSRAGGRLRDLLDDFSYRIGTLDGVGMPPVRHYTIQQALLPGSELQNVRVQNRVLTLVGVTDSTTYTAMVTVRDNLVDVLKPDLVWPLQPVILRYTGGAEDLEIKVTYDSGMQASWEGGSKYEALAIRLIAHDPFWYEVGESTATLDSNDSATIRTVLARLRSTGQWDDMGPPNVAGTYGTVNALCKAENGLVYIGGGFNNFDNIAAADYIVSYDPVAGTYASVGGGLSADVFDIKQSPDPDVLYILGVFQNAGGDANADYFCQYTISTDTFASVGIPNAGAAVITEPRSIAIEKGTGDIYVGGNFLNWADIADADYLAYWDVSAGAWAAVIAGGGVVDKLAFHPSGDLYICGRFTNWGDANGDYIVKWDGSALSSLGTGANNHVYAIAISRSGLVYIMGAFTSVDGVSAAYIASYNGASFSALGSGLNNLGFPNALVLGPDGQLWVFGVFTQAGDVPADRVAIWRNNAWHAADVDIGDVVREGIVADYGVVDSTKYSIYVGTDREGAASWGGKVTVTNPGSREAFPLIVINRSGGTSATLRHITNETANQKMQFNYLIADGETLTLDLTPGAKSITSSVFENVVDELLPRSDFADFRLLPGANEITVWVEEVGGPTVTSYVLWRAPYWSVDGVL